MMFLTLIIATTCAATNNNDSAPLTNGPAEKVADGFAFTEGPVWIPGQGLLFSDIPENTIFRPDKTVFRQDSGKSNGLSLDTDNRLIACEHWNRRVTRTEKDGSVTVIADNYNGHKFNSPNDLVARSDATIFFTDPDYGLEGRPAELKFPGLYAVSEKGHITLILKDFEKPNGLAFSLDESILYVADTARSHIRALHISNDNKVLDDSIFCEVPRPDGLRLDAKGRIWCTATDGVRVISPEGKLLETVVFPEQPANCAFGDDDYKTLYVTARTGLYKIRCNTQGHVPFAEKLNAPTDTD